MACVSAFLNQALRRDETLRRLARFFRPDADPWERLEIALPPQVFGLASHRQFHAYLEGPPVDRSVRNLEEICRFLRRCRAIDDLTLFRTQDHWQHPAAFEGLRQGDCEDHALWAWRQLHRLGQPALFVAGLWRTTAHAWVITWIRQQEHVLETMEKHGPMLVPAPVARREYVPALAVDHSLCTFAYQGYQWLHRARTGGGPPAPAALLASGDPLEVVILAGGLSSRFGRDKARARLAGRTLLARIRGTAATLGVPVRVQRKDAVARGGPLGGVLTALRRTRAGEVLFLACDMPEISSDLLRRLRMALGPRTTAVFATVEGRLGFPFLLRASQREAVQRLWSEGGRSLRELAEALGARRWEVPARLRPQLFNVNTPADLEELRSRTAATGARRSSRPPSA